MASIGRAGAGRLVAALVIALLSVSIAAGAAQAADAVGQALKVRGEAVVERAGAAQPLTTGSPLQLHDIVRTSAKARVQIQFADGSMVTLAENSGLSIDRFAVNASAKSRNVVLTVLSGLVNAAATKSGESKFDYEVHTANGYSAVRGTAWVVSQLAGVTAVYVIEGLVEVGVPTGNRVRVEAGKSVRIDPATGMSGVAPTPPEIQQDVIDATDAESANAAPDPAEAPAAPAEAAPDEGDDDAAPSQTSPSGNRSGGGGGGGSGGGGGGGHGM